MTVPQNRKLLLGGVALIKVRLKSTGAAMISICNELEGIFSEPDFFAHAPFKHVNLIIKYGLKDNFDPIYHPINKAHEELPVSIEVDARQLLHADAEQVKSVLRKATIEALLHVAAKYELPARMLVVANSRPL